MKKFIIASDELKPALKKLGQAVNAKSTLPITSNIYCKVGDNQVELITTDLEITISVICKAETNKQEPFDLLLPYDYLANIIGLSPHAPFEIEHPSVRKARIICDNEEYAINSLDKLEEFPKLPKSIKEKFTMENDIVDLLSKALFTVSKDELRPSMTRVLMDLGKESVLVSTDASTLFKQRINCEMDVAESIQFSPKMIKAMYGMTDATLAWNDKMVCIKGANTTIWCTRFNDQYPNYKAVIPALEGYEPNLEIEKDALADALHKCCISSIGTKQTTVDLLSEKGIIRFTSDDIDLGRKNQIKKVAEYTGKIAAVTINASKLLTMLNQVDVEKVSLHIHSQTKAILISSEENPDYLGLIMPLLTDK